MPDRPEIPENITDLGRDDLLSLEEQLLARFNELRESDPSDEVTAELGEIAEALPRIGERVAQIDAAEQTRAAAEAAAQAAAERREAAERAEAERQAEAERLAAEQAAAEQAAQEAAEAAAAEAAAVETAPEPETPAAPVENVVPDTPDITPEPAGELAMAASAGTPSRPSVKDIAARAPQPTAPAPVERPKWFGALTAGAEISGINAGSRFTSGQEIAQAVIRRTESIQVREGQRQAMVAQAHIDAFDAPVSMSDSASAVTKRMLEAIETYSTAADEVRDAITASGFCAPSETLYDMCEPEVADQLISLPEIPITRGGIQYFKSPALSDFNNALWGFCEPELIDGVEKPCFEIPCPEPEEVRACVEGACVKAGILMAKAFPEWVERYVRGILVAHAVRISAATIAKMEEGSVPVVYPETAAMLQGAGFTATLLNTLEFQVEDLRADYFLGAGDRPVVVLPRWVRGIIRADLANRMGVDLLQISDQYINSLFTDRGVGRIQWVKGWQTEHVGADGAQFAWPCSLRYLVYREGSWVRGLEPVIELDTLYDSALLRENKFQRLFTEQAMLVANLCTDSRVVTIPVCPSGATHCGNPVACFTDSCGSGEGEGEGSGE